MYSWRELMFLFALSTFLVTVTETPLWKMLSIHQSSAVTSKFSQEDGITASLWDSSSMVVEPVSNFLCLQSLYSYYHAVIYNRLRNNPQRQILRCCSLSPLPIWHETRSGVRYESCQNMESHFNALFFRLRCIWLIIFYT